VLASGADGINLDIEDLVAADRNDYTKWVAQVADVFHRHHLLVSIDLPVNEDAFNYEELGKLTDIVVIMGYDQFYAGGKPGPIAGDSWLEDGLHTMIKHIPPSKLVVAIGAYGYDWTLGSRQQAKSLTFEEAMVLADEHGAKIATDKKEENSTFTYKDTSGNHSVWFLDAVSAWNQYLILKKYNIHGISMWRLGMEEALIWKFFGQDDSKGSNFDPHQLQQVEALQSVVMENEGEFIKIPAIGKDGSRSLSFDGPHINYADYELLPQYFRVRRFGGGQSQKVTLTFDDGPSAEWTPQIVKILNDAHIKGTFFIVGSQLQRFPDVAKAAFQAGHMIGNHTFSHPDLRHISAIRLGMEVDSAQRMIESVLGHHTLLFRAPFDTDSSPTEPAQLTPLYAITERGYMIAAGDINSDDYAKPGVDRIVSNVMTRLERFPGSHVIVMHDAGGHRQQTVAALKILIPTLRAAGYEIVPISEILGVTPDRLMPPVSLKERLIIMATEMLNWLYVTGWLIIRILFVVTASIAILHTLFLGIFVVRSRKQYKEHLDEFTPRMNPFQLR